MDMKKLEYFLCVSRHSNFTQAAEELYVTVQGLHTSINRLEQELGTKLFLHTSDGLMLTNSGYQFHKTATNILHEYNLFREKLVDPSIIRIASTQHIAAILPTPAQRLLIGLEPPYRVAFQEERSFICEEMLLRNEVDFAISGSPFATDAFIKRKLFPFDHVMVINIQSPYAQRDFINVSDLKDISLACLNRNNKLFRIFNNLCQTASFKPNIVFEAGNAPTVCEFVRRNSDIIGIIPNFYIASINPTDIKFVTFAKQSSTRGYLYLLKSPSKPLSPHLQAFEEQFVRLVRKYTV